MQLDLIYAMTSFEFEEGGTASFHTIEFPLLARYTAWEMYGVVPRASLGLNLGANASASVDLEDAATQGVDAIETDASGFLTGFINLGAAVPMDWGDVDVDIRYKHGFTSLTKDGELSIMSLG